MAPSAILRQSRRLAAFLLPRPSATMRASYMAKAFIIAIVLAFAVGTAWAFMFLPRAFPYALLLLAFSVGSLVRKIYFSECSGNR